MVVYNKAVGLTSRVNQVTFKYLLMVVKKKYINAKRSFGDDLLRV